MNILGIYILYIHAKQDTIESVHIYPYIAIGLCNCLTFMDTTIKGVCSCLLQMYIILILIWIGL